MWIERDYGHSKGYICLRSAVRCPFRTLRTLSLGRTKYIELLLTLAIVFLVPIPAIALSYDEIMLLVQAEKKVFGQANNSQSFDDRLKTLELRAMGSAGSGSDSQRLKAVCRKLGYLPPKPVAARISGKKSKKPNEESRAFGHAHSSLSKEAKSTRLAGLNRADSPKLSSVEAEQELSHPQQSPARTPESALVPPASTSPTPKTPAPPIKQTNGNSILGYVLTAGAVLLVLGFTIFMFIKVKKETTGTEPESTSTENPLAGNPDSQPAHQAYKTAATSSIRIAQDFLSEGTQPAIQFKMCPECGASFSLEAEICDDDRAQLLVAEVSRAITMAFADHYKILSVIGSGKMSVVYRALHKMSDSPVAIKLMDSRLVQNTAAVKRFQQEAQMISRLNHPNVIGVHDFGITSERQPYMVMDFLCGKTLAETPDNYSSLSPHRVKRIFLQCASGLGQAHRLGIIHRNVKPNNIILDKDQAGDDLVKIIDFGIARMSQEATDTNFTKAGESFGTTAYMSPEQCQGKQVDQRSDIFSLGCVMFEILTGRRSDIIIPAEFELVINKALEKDPANRYQSMDELMTDLVKIPV